MSLLDNGVDANLVSGSETPQERGRERLLLGTRCLGIPLGEADAVRPAVERGIGRGWAVAGGASGWPAGAVGEADDSR